VETDHRETADSLNRRLAEKPYEFGFFQAVRRIDCAHPECPPTGYAQKAGESPVRFGQHPSLAFAPATIDQYAPAGEDGRPPRLFVNFLGLLGPNGPMPLPLTEYARQRERNHGDAALSRFLDIFNNRALAFFYRAWANSQQTVNYEWGGEDRIAVFIGSLFGIGMPSFRNRDSAPDGAKLHYASRLVCQTRHAEGLEAILGDYFALPAEIREFRGRWIPVPPASRCRIGQSRDSGLLGQTTVVGSRFYDCQQTFRIRFGPMDLRSYERLLPGQESLRRLVAWVRNYVGYELAWEAQLVLKAEEVPDTRLGQAGKLGWTTWLHSRPFQRDADELVLRFWESVSASYE